MAFEAAAGVLVSSIVGDAKSGGRGANSKQHEPLRSQDSRRLVDHHQAEIEPDLNKSRTITADTNARVVYGNLTANRRTAGVPA
jgi:hypothetical protein